MDDTKYIVFDGHTIDMEAAAMKQATCKHKSGEIEGEVESCCGKFVMKADKCMKYNIFPLQAMARGVCKEYEKK